jgi:hypothetical protein
MWTRADRSELIRNQSPVLNRFRDFSVPVTNTRSNDPRQLDLLSVLSRDDEADQVQSEHER